MTPRFPRPVDAADYGADDAPSDRLTEAGAAERFVRLHGADLRFIHPRQQWMLFRDHRWIRDVDAAVSRLALKFVREWQRAAVEVPNREQREAALKLGLRLERRDALNSMLALAATMKPVADDGAGWDADSLLLGVANGVIDLRTGKLRDGRREDRITLTTSVAFDPEAECPRFEEFLSEVFNGSDEMVDFVWRVVGYSLTGCVGEQFLLLLHGRGSNGKSTLLAILMLVLGNYAWNMPFSTIEMRDRTAIPNDLAALDGRRFVIASETNDGTRLNESRVKALTGADPITARFLHHEFFTFTPVAKFWLSVNHKPIVRDDSHGFWRRIRLLPFIKTFPVNPALADELRMEAPGILAWAVRGCVAWQQDGLRTPDAVLHATQDYETESDLLGLFIAEACESVPASAVKASELFAHYRDWAKRHGLTDREMLGATAFGRKATERFTKVRRSDGAWYEGVARR